MTWKFPQMIFTEFNYHRSLASIICEADLVKTFFGGIHDYRFPFSKTGVK